MDGARSPNSAIAVIDSFHFSHFYWRDDGLNDDDLEPPSAFYKPKPISKGDIKLHFYDNVMDSSNNIHFGKWDGIPIDDVNAYGKAGENLTDFMVTLAKDLLPHKTNIKMVDLGSGTGAAALRLTHVHAAAVESVTCLNLCHEQNTMARQKCCQNPCVQIVDGTFEDAPFANHSFDLAFSQDAFIHAVSKKQTYSEAYRMTKPGGALVFCDVMKGHGNTLSNAELLQFAESNTLNDWLTPTENVQVLESVGWKNVQWLDLTSDMRISFERMLHKVKFVLEHETPSNAMLLRTYAHKIQERLVQIDRGVFTWCVVHARKPVVLHMACAPPVPFLNTSSLILEHKNDEKEEAMSVVVVDILQKMPRERILALPSTVELLVTLSAGLDHICLEACAERGIVVQQSGRAAITSHVVQYTLAFLILGLRDALNQLGVAFPSKGWNLNWNCEGKPLTDSKIALVGMGIIAKELVAQIRAIAPSTRLFYHVPECFRDLDAETKYHLEYFGSLEDMAAGCDVLMPLCPLNAHTEHLIDAKVIGKLRPDAGIINMARGKVVDTDALTLALEQKAIRYAILDTTFPEPLPQDHALWSMDNCFIFPHYATNTMAVRKALVEEIQPIVEEHFGLGRSDDAKLRQQEEALRYDLAVAHRLTAKYGYDMLVWNHISARYQSGCLITPGRKLWSQIRPDDLVYSSTNVTADIIHAAVYAARPDVQAIIHLHSPAAVAVSCLESGFCPLTQDAAYFYNKVVNYEWDGVSDDASEGPAITAAIQAAGPDCNTLLMHNHGFCCFGKSVKEVWVLAYYFERCCETQLRVLQTGAKIKIPSKAIMAQAAETSYLPEFAPGVCEWEALCDDITFD